jgi:hypothetical protein
LGFPDGLIIKWQWQHNLRAFSRFVGNRVIGMDELLADMSSDADCRALEVGRLKANEAGRQ